MITLIFESHSTTFDNEAGRGSGWNDVELSPLGLTQCVELGARYSNTHIDTVYCSDLQRSYLTGEIAFKGRNIPIIRDARMRLWRPDAGRREHDQRAARRPCQYALSQW